MKPNVKGLLSACLQVVVGCALLALFPFAAAYSKCDAYKVKKFEPPAA